jgi:hypothetical protein
MWLSKIIVLFLFFTFNILFVTSQQLFTRDRSGNYEPILKKDGTLTKQYEGGIYIARQDILNGGNYMENVHKIPNNNWFNVRANLQPGPPDNIDVNTLYTRKRNGEYTSILVGLTRKYKGGIYVYQNGAYENIHKQPDQNYFQQPLQPQTQPLPPQPMVVIPHRSRQRQRDLRINKQNRYNLRSRRT